MKKRVISLILALMLVFTSVPMERVFAEGGSTVQTGTFTISADGIVSAYSDSAAKEIIVPTTIDGITVTQIAAGAFDGSKYSDLKSVAVLGTNVTLNANAFGYISGSRVDNFKVWGHTGSTAETYANQKAITFGVLADSITELTSSQEDLSKCFAGGNAIYMSTTISATGSEDIIWTSEDSSLVSITPYTIGNDKNGQWVATAQVKVLKTSDTKKTCKIYATTRSGLSKEMELTLAKPATEVNLSVDLYQYDKTLKVYNKVTPPATFMDEQNIYVDKGYFLHFEPDCGEDNDDRAVYSVEMGTSILQGLSATIDDESVYLYEVKNAGTVNISARTESGQVLKQYNLITFVPAEALTLKLDNVEIPAGGIAVVQGFSGKLSVGFTPTSTDTVTWSSNNSIVQISSDGTVNINGYGTAEVTCTVNNSKSMPRNLKKSFTFYVSQKYQYKEISFIDNTTDRNIITEANVPVNGKRQLNIIDSGCTDSSKAPNEPISWSSSDTTIATIDSSGMLTAKAKNGVVKITAKAESGIIQTLNVNVYVEATKITPEATSYQIPQGQVIKIPYTMTPVNTGEIVTWISDDSTSVKVISAEPEGNVVGKYILTLEILKVTSGFIDINGRSNQSNVSAQIQVKGLTAIHAESISLVPEKYVRIEKDDDGKDVYCVEKGSTFTITANVNPSSFNDTLNWLQNVHTGSILTLAINGTLASIKADSIGTTDITCTASSGIVANCKIKVIISATTIDIRNSSNASIDSLQLNLNESANLKTTLSSASTDKVTWSVVSGDASGIKFSKDVMLGTETLAITATKVGTYVVRATTDSGKYDDLTVNAVIKATNVDFMKDGKKIESLAICAGQTNRISLANILPANTTDTKFNWEETKGLLSIAPSNDGKYADITALVTGTTSIKVSGTSGASFTLNVTILIPAETLQINSQDNPEAITINKGGAKVSLYANLTPTTTTDRVTWSVNQEGIISIAQIGAISGVKQQIQIQGLEAGTVVITATTESGLTNSITVVVETVDIQDAVVTIGNQNYTGQGIKPLPTQVKVGTVALIRDTDYIITGYDSNIAAGNGIIHIQGIGKYSGAKDATFTITPKVMSSIASVTYTDSYVYTKSNIKPTVVIKYGDITLKNNVDYKVTYPTASANIGSYILKIDFMGNFSGIINKSYRVTAKSAETFVVKNASGTTLKTLPSITYTTQAITQTFYVYDGTTKLTEGTDYTVRYTNNVNAGTATVQINGKGNYLTTSFKTITFKINPYSLANVTITAIPDKTYTSSAIIPALVVNRKLANGNNRVLYAGSDYKVTYSNNTNTGKATVKITAGTNGNYSSSKSITFKILPKQVMGLKQSSASQTGVTLTWTKNAGSVSGYAIYKYNASTKKYTYVKSTASNSVTITGLSAGNSYFYAIKAYKTVGTTKYYSTAYSANVTTNTVPKTPSVSLSTASLAVTAKWAATPGASKYVVYYSTDGGKTYKQVSSTSTSYAIRSLKKGQKVYVKVKSAKIIDGKEYLSAFSAVKSITVK